MYGALTGLSRRCCGHVAAARALRAWAIPSVPRGRRATCRQDGGPSALWGLCWRRDTWQPREPPARWQRAMSAAAEGHKVTAEALPAANPPRVKVAVGQMTATGDVEENFATCRKLVEVPPAPAPQTHILFLYGFLSDLVCHCKSQITRFH